MKKFICFIILSSLITLLTANVFCGYVWSDGTIRDYAEGTDPAKGRYFDQFGNELPNEQAFSDAVARMLGEPTAAEWRAQQTAGGGNASAAAQPATATQPADASSGNSKKQAAQKEKVTVWFTDARGRVIGSTQVTKGTTVAESQFMADVPVLDDGRTFDKWDYDGRVIEHERIIRANYK